MGGSVTMSEKTHRTTANGTEDAPRTGILDVLLAELEADDGTNGEALRRALAVEDTETTERIAEIENEIELLRADLDERAAAEAKLRAMVENNLEPRLDSVDRRLQELENRLRDLESETRGLRSELTAVRDSVSDAQGEGADGAVVVDSQSNAADIDALADDFDELEQTVATAFNEITSDLERDLETLQANLQDDIGALERRLSVLEQQTRNDAIAETDWE